MVRNDERGNKLRQRDQSSAACRKVLCRQPAPMLYSEHRGAFGYRFKVQRDLTDKWADGARPLQTSMQGSGISQLGARRVEKPGSRHRHTYSGQFTNILRELSRIGKVRLGHTIRRRLVIHPPFLTLPTST